MAKKNIDIEAEAVGLVKRERQEWEDAVAFVTEKVAFNMRNLLRQCRRNYWGIFEEKQDPITGRDKIWTHLTKSTVEAVVKNIDLDTKDINFRAKKASAIGMSMIVRNIAKNYLDDIFFGEYLDKMERTLAIDGTAVWSTEEANEKGKKKLDLRQVDLLNFYIDPTAESIHKTDAVIERIILTVDEFKNLATTNKWINYEDIEGTTNVPKYDASSSHALTGNSTKMVELYRRRGKTPLSFITGKEDDKKELINGEVIVSGSGNNWKFHNVEKRKDDNKGYEECWYTRVPGRWYGEGIAEKLMMEQLYINIVRNIRITKHSVSQLGIFKIKSGSGITPQSFSKMAVNGAIKVNAIDDIEQFVINEASQSSYTDEQNSFSWAERLTSAFEVVTGESMPATTPATNAVLQDRNAQSTFVLVKEGIGMFLQRWLKNQAMPIIFKHLTKGDVLRISDDVEELEELDENIVNFLAYQQIEKKMDEGKNVNMAKMAQEMENARERIRKFGPNRYFKYLSEANPLDYDVQVYITNEEIDKGVAVQNLIATLNMAPEYREAILKQIFDLIGIDVKKLKPQPMPMTPGQAGAPVTPQNNLQEVTTQANIPQYGQ